ncbi:RcnB family protein [Vannielia litorea]|uniref:RcnB family protein n=1 Tax=Vannielia litorea TaxID=1217970 RepID=UPI001C9561D4|nr:RcnB family protein [Vannielia litorea]MBY6153448.1 RcnB family protein [Vannielia litorea]
MGKTQMNRALATVLIVVTTIATAPAAFAAPEARPCAEGQRGACSQPQRGEARHDTRQHNPQANHRADKKDDRHAAKRSTEKRGHAPTQAQLKRLPKPPRGQEYRVIGNRVVRIDSDTLQTVAVLGLLSALLN